MVVHLVGKMQQPLQAPGRKCLVAAVQRVAASDRAADVEAL
jgi:hypothetical protein